MAMTPHPPPTPAELERWREYLAAEGAGTDRAGNGNAAESVRDVAIGFGHFDWRIVDRCAELVRRGQARGIIFTGGIGAGTGDLGQPEAAAFAARLASHHPDLPASCLWLAETASTNTAENILCTQARLQAEQPHRSLGAGIGTAWLVATPARMRRVELTVRRHVPELRTICAPPVSTGAEEEALYARQRGHWLDQMRGEVARLIAYAERGWIASERVPADVLTILERRGGG